MKKLIIILILLITGCTKYNDLAELTIIKSIGIDYNENYIVYAQIIDYIDENNKPIMKTIKENGKTINEGFSNLKKRINKEIYLSHIDLLVLGNTLKKENYQNIINYFINNNDFRNDFYCIFSSDIYNLFEKTNYDEIEILLKTKDKSSIKNFDNVIQEFIDNKTIILPEIIYQHEINYLDNVEYKENSYEKEN